MVESSIGGDLEVTPSSELPRETVLRRMEDEIEYMRIGCDKLSRNDKVTADRIGALENQIAAMASESNARFGVLESQMLSITEMLSRIEENAVFTQRQGKGIASSSATLPDQVHHPTIHREQTPLGYRGFQDTLANRDKMLKKVDMPVFAGPLPFDWLSRVERFFRIGNYNDEEKLQLVSLSLEGPVLQWFNGEQMTEPFLSWDQFTERMLERFGGPIDNDPAARLFCIQQEGEIADYVSEFEALRNQVTGIDEKNLIKVFYNGLKPEMKEVIRMKEPVSLTGHKLAVLKMQSTTFCKVIGSASGGDTTRGSHRQTYTNRTTSVPTKQSGEQPRLEAGANKKKFLHKDKY